jgi:hypothetical protein
MAWILAALGLGWMVRKMDDGGGWFTVWTTTFGSQGLSTGGAMDTEADIVASLPSTKYKHRSIEVQALDKALQPIGPVVRMSVLDTGPHYVDDDYPEHGERPLAALLCRVGASGWEADTNPSRTAVRLAAQREEYRLRPRPRQGAGLDLSVKAWRALGIKAARPLDFSGWARWRWAA